MAEGLNLIRLRRRLSNARSEYAPVGVTLATWMQLGGREFDSVFRKEKEMDKDDANLFEEMRTSFMMRLDSLKKARDAWRLACSRLYHEVNAFGPGGRMKDRIQKQYWDQVVDLVRKAEERDIKSLD